MSIWLNDQTFYLPYFWYSRYYNSAPALYDILKAVQLVVNVYYCTSEYELSKRYVARTNMEGRSSQDRSYREVPINGAQLAPCLQRAQIAFDNFQQQPPLPRLPKLVYESVRSKLPRRHAPLTEPGPLDASLEKFEPERKKRKRIDDGLWVLLEVAAKTTIESDGGALAKACNGLKSLGDASKLALSKSLFQISDQKLEIFIGHFESFDFQNQSNSSEKV